MTQYSTTTQTLKECKGGTDDRHVNLRKTIDTSHGSSCKARTTQNLPRRLHKRAYGRSAVNISNRANGAFGEHLRHDNDGMSPEIAPPGCRSSVRRSTEPN